MKKQNYCFILLSILTGAASFGQNIRITLKNNAPELTGENQLERILKTHGVKTNRWIFTTESMIAKNAVPFSHPILTSNCNYLDIGSIKRNGKTPCEFHIGHSRKPCLQYVFRSTGNKNSYFFKADGMNKSTDVTDYLNSLPLNEQKVLGALRAQILRLVPAMEERLSRHVPFFYYKGKRAVGYRSSKTHLSFFIMEGNVLNQLKNELNEYDVSSTVIRFNSDNPLGEEVIAKLVLARVEEIDYILKPGSKIN